MQCEEAAAALKKGGVRGGGEGERWQAHGDEKDLLRCDVQWHRTPVAAAAAERQWQDDAMGCMSSSSSSSSRSSSSRSNVDFLFHLLEANESTAMVARNYK
jgi:hypothetical protein